MRTPTQSQTPDPRHRDRPPPAPRPSAALIALAFALSACGTFTQNAPATNGIVAACIRRRRVELAQAHVASDATLPTIAIDVGLVERGHHDFDRVCGNCHPRGHEDVGPELIGLGLSVDVLVRQVREGGRTMSAIPPTCVPDDAMEPLIAYLRTLGTVR